MNLELIQPFINSADAVLGTLLQGRIDVAEVGMDQIVYRRKGVAAVVAIRGEIEGRVIFDLAVETAANVATRLAVDPGEATPEIIHETVLELANQVVGNAVTTLNDAGVRLKVRPPELYPEDRGLESSEDTETLVLCFDTSAGSVFMNIAMRLNPRSAA